MGAIGVFNFIECQRTEIEIERKRIEDLKRNYCRELCPKEQELEERDSFEDWERKKQDKIVGVKLEPLQRRIINNNHFLPDDDKISVLSFAKELPAVDNEHIIPTGRLLTTNESRIKAERYRQELMEQIEDKRRRRLEEMKRERAEEMLLEKKIQEQRRKMHDEYLDEQRRLRKKTDELLQKQEANKLLSSQSNEFLVIPSASSRSPSYMHLRSPRIRRKNLRQESQKFKIKKCQQNNTNLSGDELQVAHENGDNKETGPETRQEKYHNNNLISKPHLLGHLTDIRQQIKKDHFEMLEKLKIQESED